MDSVHHHYDTYLNDKKIEYDGVREIKGVSKLQTKNIKVSMYK